MSREISTLQQKIADLLQGDAVFTPSDPKMTIQVFTQKLGDLANQIKTKVSKLGISAVVVTPLIKLPEPTIDAINVDVPFVVQITEEPTINKTGWCAFDLACEVICLVHGAPTGLGNPRICRFQVTETPLTLVDESPTYHVNFVAKQVALIPRRAAPADGVAVAIQPNPPAVSS